jgi:hypothetical protein
MDRANGYKRQKTRPLRSIWRVSSRVRAEIHTYSLGLITTKMCVQEESLIEYFRGLLTPPLPVNPLAS